jgi:hypothetical protein
MKTATSKAVAAIVRGFAGKRGGRRGFVKPYFADDYSAMRLRPLLRGKPAASSKNALAHNRLVCGRQIKNSDTP